jgi:protein SCO1
MKTLIAITVLCLSGFACKETTKASLPFFNTPDFTPEWIDEPSADRKDMHTIPSFSFTDQNNSNVTDKAVDGKIYVADFFFTKCSGICPTMTSNMSKVSAAFTNDKDVLILSHSVTPGYDSVATLKKYALAKGITNSNWHLLTGDKEKIYNIARKGYFADERTGYNKDTTEFLHTENFILVDKHRRIRGVYNGTIELEVNQLIEHIKLLKKEE